MKTHEIRYPVHPYTTFIDFPQDIQNDKVLRRKSLEWLDFEKLVIKLKYQPEDSYLSAFYDDNDVCYVASGTFLSRICFKSLQTIDFCKIHSRINCVQKIDKFIVIGTMMGDVIFTDLTGNIVFQFMISSIVKGPIGQFKEYKKLIFAIGHRIITKINITNQKFEIFAEFGSIYGIVFDEIKGTCLVACDTGLISLVID
ncbi:hypothetical protein SS50377_25302 [Spironucleus salmonicida]|uniref:Uncharacterized protein n=1 Tax=Spironucleus salmonicida TaxID=348837 RepID=V6LBM0_9EUKA|nr:hypothetical protein SS50377_25302 [Spironucleus salmonicida]|eukprot:EST41817.1 Hypothetical protein SS50377_18651 [Spironucleus salmonicida]